MKLSDFYTRIFLTVWVVYLFHFNVAAAGSDRFVYLVMAMVEHHTFNIDAYRHLTTELSFYAGHYYLNTNPGLSFLAFPVWALLRPLYDLLPGAWCFMICWACRN